MDTEKVVPFDAEEMTDWEREMVDRAVGVNIALRHASRVELREALGIWAAALQKAVIVTHDEEDERKMRMRVKGILEDAKSDALAYRRKAQARGNRYAARKQGERDGR